MTRHIFLLPHLSSGIQRLLCLTYPHCIDYHRHNCICASLHYFKQIIKPGKMNIRAGGSIFPPFPLSLLIPQSDTPMGRLQKEGKN